MTDPTDHMALQGAGWLPRNMRGKRAPVIHRSNDDQQEDDGV
jgi:hypothetical protein